MRMKLGHICSALSKNFSKYNFIFLIHICLCNMIGNHLNDPLVNLSKNLYINYMLFQQSVKYFKDEIISSPV